MEDDNFSVMLPTVWNHHQLLTPQTIIRLTLSCHKALAVCYKQGWEKKDTVIGQYTLHYVRSSHYFWHCYSLLCAHRWFRRYYQGYSHIVTSLESLTSGRLFFSCRIKLVYIHIWLLHFCLLIQMFEEYLKSLWFYIFAFISIFSREVIKRYQWGNRQPFATVLAPLGQNYVLLI